MEQFVENVREVDGYVKRADILRERVQSITKLVRICISYYTLFTK